MLDEQLLSNFIATFYGYGDYRAQYWFVGMEEGGGDTLEANAARLAAWDSRGRRELEDLVEYHSPLGVSRYTGERPKIQATWGKLIRILLSAEGATQVNPEQVRAYQREHLGREGGENCLLELL